MLFSQTLILTFVVLPRAAASVHADSICTDTTEEQVHRTIREASRTERELASKIGTNDEALDQKFKSDLLSKSSNASHEKGTEPSSDMTETRVGAQLDTAGLDNPPPARAERVRA